MAQRAYGANGVGALTRCAYAAPRVEMTEIYVVVDAEIRAATVAAGNRESRRPVWRPSHMISDTRNVARCATEWELSDRLPCAH